VDAAHGLGLGIPNAAALRRLKDLRRVEAQQVVVPPTALGAYNDNVETLKQRQSHLQPGVKQQLNSHHATFGFALPQA
jgi:hypothetical protein